MNDQQASQLRQWIGRCTLKDQQALSALYQATSSQLFAVVLRILKNRSLAEETLQEVYVKVWNNAASYNDSKGEPMAWLVGIARYRSLDVLRHQKTKQHYESLYEVEQNIESPEFSDTLADSDDAVVLGECLDRLQANARRSVVMAYCEGYTHQELSEKMDKPIGTVKSWIRRSLKHLQECIHELSAP